MPANEALKLRLYALEEIVFSAPSVVGFIGGDDIDAEDIDVEDVVHVVRRDLRCCASTHVPEGGEPRLDTRVLIERTACDIHRRELAQHVREYPDWV